MSDGTVGEIAEKVKPLELDGGRQCVALPLADVQTPSCHDPQRDAKNHQHGPGVRRHQRFPHKAGVEVDLRNPEEGYACVIIRPT